MASLRESGLAGNEGADDLGKVSALGLGNCGRMLPVSTMPIKVGYEGETYQPSRQW